MSLLTSVYENLRVLVCIYVYEEWSKSTSSVDKFFNLEIIDKITNKMA